MKLTTMLQRLRRAEAGANRERVTVRLKNGAETTIRIRDPLALLLESFRRQHLKLEGEPVPSNKFDAPINLLGGCASVDSTDNLILLTVEECQKTKHVTKQESEK
jgi:hypothetical protein